MLASAVATLDANAVKVAVPAIGRDLGASISALQWTLTSSPEIAVGGDPGQKPAERPVLLDHVAA